MRAHQQGTRAYKLGTRAGHTTRMCKRANRARDHAGGSRAGVEGAIALKGMLQLSDNYGRIVVLLSFRRAVYCLFLFQVVTEKSGAYDEEVNNGVDADTSRALRTTCGGR